MPPSHSGQDLLSFCCASDCKCCTSAGAGCQEPNGVRPSLNGHSRILGKIDGFCKLLAQYCVASCNASQPLLSRNVLLRLRRRRCKKLARRIFAALFVAQKLRATTSASNGCPSSTADLERSTPACQVDFNTQMRRNPLRYAAASPLQNLHS